MHDQMRSQINRERKRVEIREKLLFLFLQLLVGWFLRRLQFNFFPVPATTQSKIMITEHGGKLFVRHETLEYFPVLRTLGYQIPDANEPVVVVKMNLIKQVD